MVLHNPNNWHWVDKNCIEWSRTYFQKKLSGISANSDKDKLNIQIDKVTSVEGDVEVSQRKGRLISLFDLIIKLDFSGKFDDQNIKGSINIPEVAYDSEKKDYQFNITLDDDSLAKHPIKEFVRSSIVPQLQDVLYNFKTDLINTHGKDIQHPADQVKSKLTLSNQYSNGPASNSPDISIFNSNSSKQGIYNTSSLELSHVFNTTAEELYKTFLEPDRVAMWTRSPAKIESRENSEFSLFNSNVMGKIVKLEKNKRIVQLWRLKEWKEGHYTTLDLNFQQNSSDTKLNITWSDIPIGQEDLVRNNFEEYYVKSIQITFGFGAPL